MNLNNILFLDIETVSHVDSFEALDEKWAKLWENKSKYFKNELESQSPADWFPKKAGIFAEFGKIVCIGLGFYKGNTLRLKAIKAESEAEILKTFFAIVEKHFSNPNQQGFCGHNIREFDIPYICRRALINEVNIPEILQLASRKPWEVKYILDTLELWRFGDFKHYVSLDLLAACLNLPSSKTNMNGSQVSEEYWKSNRIDDISAYCLEDVALTFKVFCKLSQLTEWRDLNIQYSD
ncbi:MAG: 3'-5' exonuclease [Saprospiraceae bacterium]|nr:3'-5' exonuclease [Saprospiraceae bacterium]